jgi:hypothetical protein
MTDSPKDMVQDADLLSDSALLSADPERIVRLFRLAQEAELSSCTQTELGLELLRMMDGGHDQDTSPIEVVHGDLPDASKRDDPGRTSQQTTTPVVVTEAGATSSQTSRVDRLSAGDLWQATASGDPERAILEMKLRQLAQAEASWERMEPVALDLFARGGSPHLAARLVELAFLHGKMEHVADFIVRFRNVSPGFYRLIHPTIRAHLVVRLYSQDLDCAGLATILFADREADYLQPTERLFILLTMAQGHDVAQAYVYFRRHQRLMLNAAHSVGGSFGITPAALFLKMGRLAVELRNPAEAREFLEKIDQNAPEREEALVLLLNLDADSVKSGQSHYASELEGAAGDRTRLEKLASFLAATRGLGGYKDRNRPALNDILRHPLQWFGDLPEIWSGLSLVLIASRDLEPLLPNIWDLFKANITKWHAPLLDRALWEGPLRLTSSVPLDMYWYGIGKLHLYVNTQGAEAQALWEARELIHKARQGSILKGDLPDWSEIHRATFAWISKTHHLMEVDRSRMLREMRLASPDSSTSLSDVDDYLNQSQLPIMPILNRLIQIAQTKRALALEARILIARGFICHLTNTDLDRLWQIGCERKDQDLAWRVATVLRGRGALAKIVSHPWDICGEKRSHYQPLKPSLSQVMQSLEGLPRTGERLAKAVLHVGSALPELLAILDAKAVSSRVSAAPSDSVEAQADQALGQLDWLPAMRRRYVLSFDQAGGPQDIPAFAQVLPANAWSVLVARLSERLGLNAWRWRLSFLSEQLVDVIPRLASRRDLGRHSNKVAKWLRNLTPEQRGAWQELTSLSRILSDEDALFALSALVCRTAILIMPHHALALSSLMAMRAPVGVRWDLEQFILSTFYGEYRQKLGMMHKVPIPHALLRLTSVVEMQAQS